MKVGWKVDHREFRREGHCVDIRTLETTRGVLNVYVLLYKNKIDQL